HQAIRGRLRAGNSRGEHLTQQERPEPSAPEPRDRGAAPGPRRSRGPRVHRSGDESSLAPLQKKRNGNARIDARQPAHHVAVPPSGDPTRYARTHLPTKCSSPIGRPLSSANCTETQRLFCKPASQSFSAENSAVPARTRSTPPTPSPARPSLPRNPSRTVAPRLNTSSPLDRILGAPRSDQSRATIHATAFTSSARGTTTS